MPDSETAEMRRAVDDLIAAYSQPAVHKVVDFRTRAPVYARDSLAAALANIEAVRAPDPNPPTGKTLTPLFGGK